VHGWGETEEEAKRSSGREGRWERGRGGREGQKKQRAAEIEINRNRISAIQSLQRGSRQEPWELLEAIRGGGMQEV